MNDEETADPYRDESGDILCDECYSEHYEYICPICQDCVAIEGNQEHIIVTQALADDQRMESGVYRIAARPWFSSDYFSMRVRQEAVVLEDALPSEALEMVSGDYVCERCVMRWRKVKQRTLKQYREDALQAAARSHSLWQSVNRVIAEVLDVAIRNRHSRNRVYARLMRIAGSKKPGESVSVGSFRAAARQIANRRDRLTLI